MQKNEAYDGQTVHGVSEGVRGAGESVASVDQGRACLRKEFINRAEMIVRGTQEPDSGWYNSPDDLVAIITLQLSRAYKDGHKDGLRTLADTPHGELTAFGDTTARVVVEEVKGAARRLAAKAE